MLEQIVFAITLIVTLGYFTKTVLTLISYFRVTKPFPMEKRWGERISLTLKVAFGQSKILRKPFIGLMHALVFWGFLVITVGSLEMVIDGLTGQHRTLAALGKTYNVLTASGDLFAFVVLAGVVLFLIRRLFFHIKRFYGRELTPKNKRDANISLLFIAGLMISLIALNTFDLLLHGDKTLGSYPVSSALAALFPQTPVLTSIYFKTSWWAHILLIFIFANYLPYSKHFHVFMSVPNVFFSNLKPLSYLPAMPEITHEVKLMLSGDAFQGGTESAPTRFGVKDVEDVTWKNYMDALTCTQCGRCTEVCPANITGKELSPRKIFVDLRNRMNEKAPFLSKTPKYHDNKALVGDFITPEELWACTTCNACAQECPLNISHPNLIMDMRRYLVLEEGNTPESLSTMFANIENNGAPWKYSPEDRLNWTLE